MCSKKAKKSGNPTFLDFRFRAIDEARTKVHRLKTAYFQCFLALSLPFGNHFCNQQFFIEQPKSFLCQVPALFKAYQTAFSSPSACGSCIFPYHASCRSRLMAGYKNPSTLRSCFWRLFLFQPAFQGLFPLLQQLLPECTPDSGRRRPLNPVSGS